MNVEIGAEAAQFPEKEYINGIAFAVYIHLQTVGGCAKLQTKPLKNILSLSFQWRYQVL
jgi:hypothetical protein